VPSGSHNPPVKPFQSKGLVRRVTPFMGAGLIALVVFSDPTFSRLAWADALAVSGPGRHQEGTGLGLALTKRLAALHGGDVRVVSELGKGSVLTLELPLRQPAGVGLASTPGGRER